jgi:ADP-ribose pyrophosphatase
VGAGEAAVKPLKSETAFTTPWFELIAKTMREGEEPYYSLRLRDYATIVALTAEGKLLVVRQYRPSIEQFTLELPSGIVDEGETPAQAASRELLEETGYHAAQVEILGPMQPDLGRLSNRSWGLFAKDVRKVEGRAPEEGIEVFEWTLEDFYGAVADGRFSHALHIAIVFQAVLLGKVGLPADPRYCSGISK